MDEMLRGLCCGGGALGFLVIVAAVLFSGLKISGQQDQAALELERQLVKQARESK